MSTETLVIRDNRESGKYFIDTILIKGGYAKELGVYGVAVYNVLASYANNDTQGAWPSYQTIADLLGCSRRKVIQAVANLERLGMVYKEKRPNDKGRLVSCVVLKDLPGDNDER